MADSPSAGTGSRSKPSGPSGAAAASQAPKGNPAFRMMGMPNFRFKFPSRNWMIFWTIVGSWTAVWYYDRHEKKKIQRKWATVVQHMASEPIAMNALPRKLTVYLTAPPADTVMTAREHFHEYIKPILAASGVDWDAIEGRREGDVRAQLAEKIRKLRKRKGEPTESPIEDLDGDVLLDNERTRMGVIKSLEVEGDIVIGRNTWKEYVRGLHEGWLGPLDQPQSQEAATQENGNGDGNGLDKEKPPRDRPHDIGSIPTYAAEKIIERATPKRKDQPHEDESPTSLPPQEQTTSDDSAPTPADEKTEHAKAEEDKESKSKKRKQPPPFISPSEYPSANLSPNVPPEFAPSTIIQLPHILGIRNTPTRIYRFLTRRYLADDVGRQVAAAVFADYRPYHQYDSSSSASSPFPEDSTSPTSFATDDDASGTPPPPQQTWEQQRLLESEEPEWHKSLRKERDPEKESVWLDAMVIDPRIGNRMRRFQIPVEEEERANRILSGLERAKEKVTDEDLA